MTSSMLSDKARTVLSEKRFAVLATINTDGTPHLSVMWYELQGDEVLMNTKVGRVKEQNMRHDPRISICIEDDYNYISLSGTVHLIDEQDIAQADIRHLAERYHNPERAEKMMQNMFGKEQRVTMRMSIEKVLERV